MGGSNRSELYSELDDYLSRRRVDEPVIPKPKGFLKRIFSRKIKSRPLPETQPVFEVGDHEPVHTSFLSRVTGRLAKPPVYEEVEPVDNTKDDLRELAKVFMKTLEMLPDKDLQNFKSTEEFFKFKSILSKHSLIRSSDTQPKGEEILKQ